VARVSEKAPAVDSSKSGDPPAYTVSSARVDTTNNDTDRTKKKQSRASLVHDTGLANGRHAILHATLPTVGVAVLVEPRLLRKPLRDTHLFVGFYLRRRVTEPRGGGGGGIHSIWKWVSHRGTEPRSPGEARHGGEERGGVRGAPRVPTK
jgi:hypothetical protein